MSFRHAISLVGLFAASAAFAQQPAPQPQPAPGDAIEGDFAPYQAADIDPARPLGDLDITGVGATPNDVFRYLGGLTGAQVIDIALRCAVVTPYADFEENPPAAGEAAPAPAAGAAPAGAASVTYPADAAAFCQNVNIVLHGLVVQMDPAAAPAPAAPRP
jgi:hypothetical protein